MSDEDPDDFEGFISSYCDTIETGFRQRWSKYKPEIYNNEISEAIGGLSARQATLANVGLDPWCAT